MKILIYLDSECYHHPPVMMGKIIAQATQADLSVLVVIPKDGHLENGDAIADQAILDLEGLTPKVTIKQGSPYSIIKEELFLEEYHLVIANSERISRVRKLVDVDPILINQAKISLLITQNTKPKIDKILLCSACKEDDYSLITQGANFARNLGSSVTLLYVFPGAVPTMYTGLDQIDESVEKLLQTDTPFAIHLRRGVEILEENELDSEVKIRHGIPIEEIVRETQINNYDLVIIGSSKVNEGLIEMLLGNLTIKIIDKLDLPVLVIGTRDLV
ncbi:MAG: universal stress protein [Anaerolineales bacterium]|nr:universal stress protein [Anaerolineales bacterium]